MEIVKFEIGTNRSPKSLEEWVKERNYSSIFVLVDENTYKYCYPVLEEQFKETKEVISIPAGEGYKNIDTVEFILKKLLHLGADRNTLLINLGGGVICDIGGFCASVFRRGIDCVNIPTTLLGMIDAGIGGKTGIDLEGYKNQIGSFWMPQGFFIYQEFLKTLESRQLKSGYGELMKYALIDKTQFLWEWIQNRDFCELPPEDIIRRCIEIKTGIVKKDPLEKNVRKILNLGHTLGHAFETFFLNKGQGILHGEAIAAGLAAEAILSVKLSGLAEETAKKITNIYFQQYERFSFEIQHIDEIIQIMRFDKKNTGEEINFTLLADIGKIICNKFADIESIRNSLITYRNL